MDIAWISLIVVAYLMGSIPVGVAVTRFFGGADPRTMGSGNIGATNVRRAAGKTAGIVTLIGDCLKGFLPTLFAFHFFPSVKVVGLTGLAAFLGHIFPVFLRFKGGKGVATALGVFLVISPIATLLSVVVFVILLLIFRYVSLSSISAAVSMPIFLGLLPSSKSFAPLGAMVAVIIILTHTKNIKRIIEGKENRPGKS
jgi:glycerol-3-phosphate acyltransferase PlsY